MNWFKYYIKKNIIQLLTAFFILFVFVYQGKASYFNDGYGSIIGNIFNERIFLALYVIVFLIGLFPVLKKIYHTEYLVRISSKWNFLEKICFRVCIISFEYSIILSFGWYIASGFFMSSYSSKRDIIYVLIFLLKQLIGWIEIGMMEVFIYILFKNLALAFVLSDGILIMLNLSLYSVDNQVLQRYLRLYDFMIYSLTYGNIYIMFSTVFFHIAVIFCLFLLSHELLKKHDFISGVKKVNAG